MRTTLDLEKPVLEDLKRLQKEEKLPLGNIASRLLADAMDAKRRTTKAPRFEWASAPMGAKVDLADKDSLYRELDKS